MIEGFEKGVVQDKHPEKATPLEKQREFAEGLLRCADEELKMLAPALRELADRIVEQRPEYVVFIDKGARMLAVPIRKWLRGRGLQNVPQFVFYNDQRLKTSYIEKREEVDVVAREELAALAGKKVLFVDETFSSGKGAVPLRRAMDLLNMDGTYFALSYESNPNDLAGRVHGWRGDKFYAVKRSEHLKNLRAVQSDPRFVIKQNPTEGLFTKRASRLYVGEHPVTRKTEKRFEMVPDEDADATYDYAPQDGQLPNARQYEKPPEGLSWQEYDQQVRELNYETVSKLSEKIYETLLFRELPAVEWWAGAVETSLPDDEFEQQLTQTAKDLDMRISGYRTQRNSKGQFTYGFSSYVRRGFGPLPTTQNYKDALRVLKDSTAGSAREEKRIDEPKFQVLFGLVEGYDPQQAVTHTAAEVQQILGDQFEITPVEILAIGGGRPRYTEPAVLITGNLADVRKIYDLADRFRQERIVVQNLQAGKSYAVETRWCKKPDPLE